ncbi:MobA/MobL family protein [Alteraurantiacibacter aquimixticola]|uniref:MobA/MobL protein domain-containing protein n=1 Tax=Alteraurantiacibacter aquimixticola TaxID=2489173 RepID=A0A4T3F1Q4_9SPHN|nr:MobA/MobL family protein [Alteraurantiacibacter aquimixticola]TIX50497.1 hypothetical protein E5222_09515 [Alteraurantiacibacter aquimixticola]
MNLTLGLTRIPDGWICIKSLKTPIKPQFVPIRQANLECRTEVTMPTNRQMESRDDFEASRIRIKLIKDGILDDISRTSSKAGRHSRRSNSANAQANAASKVPRFNIPAARSYRFSNAEGVTTFHFAHKAIAKVTFDTCRDGVRNKPGAARGHARYIERECAVADIASDVVPSQEHTAVDDAFVLQAASTVPKVVEQDRYVIRSSAVAMQTDGNRALLTNIDPDDDARAEFWSLVEQHERNPTPDKMSMRFADHPEFWSQVASDPNCPRELKEKILGPDRDKEAPFQIGNGKKVRAFLSGQEGWVGPRTKEQNASANFPMAKFADGRGGRTQYRIEFELPAELTARQRFALVRDFAKEFEGKDIPFVAVMHEPDHHNHSANWHAHFIYYDRPCRRIDQNDIQRLKREGFDTASLRPGMWDFTVALAKPGRRGRTSFPLRRKKVAVVSRTRIWPKTLRKKLAEVTNNHLALAGRTRRVSPDTFQRIGITADPQEHLGSAQNAAETNGEATALGIANERKQWLAIQAQAEADYRSALEICSDRVRKFVGKDANAAEKSEDCEKLESCLVEAAYHRKTAFLILQEMERAASRALLIHERNSKRLKAFEAQPGHGRDNEIVRSAQLVEKSAEFLEHLDSRQADERVLVANRLAKAVQCEATARTIERAERSFASGSAQLAARETMPEKSAAAVSTPVVTNMTSPTRGAASQQDQLVPKEPQVLKEWREAEETLHLAKLEASSSREISRHKAMRDQRAWMLRKALRQHQIDPSLIDPRQLKRIKEQAADRDLFLQQQNAMSLGMGR